MDDPALAVMAAVHETLTTPDSEDWTVIPDRDVVHVIAAREVVHDPKPEVVVGYGPAPLAEFKRAVESLPPGHDLGCVTVLMCRDYEATGGVELFGWLSEQARAKNFSLTTMHGRATTEEAVGAAQSRFRQRQ